MTWGVLRGLWRGIGSPKWATEEPERPVGAQRRPKVGPGVQLGGPKSVQEANLEPKWGQHKAKVQPKGGPAGTKRLGKPGPRANIN
jgi:hypothetical protein